jgi:hypothetical protein
VGAHHRLPERGVGRGEHRPDDRRLPEGEVGEQQGCGTGTECDGERHPDAKKAQGQSFVLSQGGEVDPRGIGKQYEDEGDLAKQEHGVVVEPELDQAQPRGT